MNNCQRFTYKKNNYIEQNGIKEIFIRNEVCKYTTNHNLCLKYLF